MEIAVDWKCIKMTMQITRVHNNQILSVGQN